MAQNSSICRSGWPSGFGELNPSPHSIIFTFVSVSSSPCSYLFASARVRIPLHTALTCGTEPIPHVSLHFQDPRSAALLCYRNYPKITVLMREQKPYPVWFSSRHKSCVNIALVRSLTQQMNLAYFRSTLITILFVSGKVRRLTWA